MKIAKIQEKASEKLSELDMPESIRTPGRTWTSYPEIAEIEAEKAVPEINVSGDVTIETGKEARQKAKDKIFSLLKIRENRLTALHARKTNSIVYIGAEGEAEVEISYAGEETFSHVIVEAAQGSELELTEDFRNKGLTTSFTEIFVEENATVRYGALERSDSELSYSRRKAKVKDYGTMEWLNTAFTGDLKRTKIETVLEGDGSETEKLAVWYPTGEQHVDVSLHAYHRGENTGCQMDSRAVVDDESRSVYEGLQHVGDSADDTQSFQDEEVLTLSDRAEVDASPKLMIKDPNVEASHAASSGNLPEKELHYLESRGLDQEEARNLIVGGFFEPVLEEIELENMKEAVREEVERKLNG